MQANRSQSGGISQGGVGGRQVAFGSGQGGSKASGSASTAPKGDKGKVGKIFAMGNRGFHEGNLPTSF